MFASCLQVTTIVFVVIVTWLSSRTRLHDCHRGSLDHRQHQHHWTLSPGCPQGTGWPPGRCSPQLPELESSTEASRPMWVSPDLWFNLELVIRSNRPLSQSSNLTLSVDARWPSPSVPLQQWITVGLHCIAGVSVFKQRLNNETNYGPRSHPLKKGRKQTISPPPSWREPSLQKRPPQPALLATLPVSSLASAPTSSAPASAWADVGICHYLTLLGFGMYGVQCTLYIVSTCPRIIAACSNSDLIALLCSHHGA